MSRLLRVAAKVVGPRMDPDVLHPVDEDLVSLALPITAALERYFRSEVRGVEHIPAGKVLIVGNHNAGMTFLEPFLFGRAYYLQRQEMDIHGLGHDAIVGMPFLGNLLMMLGAVRAGHHTADEAFARGHKVIVFPGGNYEAFRPFTERNKVDFGGHKGFVRLAIRQGVPIVPLLSVGGHHGFVVLARGERLARATGFKRLLRSDALPVILALPYGLFVGPMFHLPLPARVTVVVGPPITPEGALPVDADDDAVVDRWYDVVTGSLQRMMDAEVTRRRSRSRLRRGRG